MPIYEYACTACGERTEAKQSFDDPPLETCPACGGKLRKLYSPVGIVFKGSGFYATDSKGSTNKSTSSASASGSSGSGTSNSNPNASDTSKKSSDSGTTATKKESPAK